MKPLALIPVVLFAVLGVFFYVSLQDGGDDTLPSVLVGRPAPDTDLAPLADRPDHQGAETDGLASSDLADGTVKLVNFWASWCAPCRTEHPVLTALAEDEGITIHGVNYKDRPDGARRFLRALGDPFARVGVDETGRTGIDWGVYGVPETFVVDGEGHILARHVGPLTEEAWNASLSRYFKTSATDGDRPARGAGGGEG